MKRVTPKAALWPGPKQQYAQREGNGGECDGPLRMQTYGLKCLQRPQASAPCDVCV